MGRWRCRRPRGRPPPTRWDPGAGDEVGEFGEHPGNQQQPEHQQRVVDDLPDHVDHVHLPSCAASRPYRDCASAWSHSEKQDPPRRKIQYTPYRAGVAQTQAGVAHTHAQPGDGLGPRSVPFLGHKRHPSSSRAPIAPQGRRWRGYGVGVGVGTIRPFQSSSEGAPGRPCRACDGVAYRLDQPQLGSGRGGQRSGGAGDQQIGVELPSSGATRAFMTAPSG